MNNVLAVDIGGTHFRVGLFDEQGRRLLVLDGDTDRNAGRDWMLSELAKRCRDLLANTDAPVQSCGVSVGGPVDFPQQRVTSLNPDIIVLGGGVAQSGTLLLENLHTSLVEMASPTITYSTEIVTAGLGNHSPLYGAAAMALKVV